MVNYIIESWHIFLGNLAKLNGGIGIAALLFLFAIFLVFWKTSHGFGSQKKE